jgi:formate C-acetyltransferase
MSVEQAKIVTDVYRVHSDLPRNILRALALKEALNRIEIGIAPGELIVGNRTTGVRAGVIFRNRV